MKLIKTTLGNIGYIQSGDASAPNLLFLHNGGTDHSIWLPIIDLFQSNYFMTAIDWPSHGASIGLSREDILADYSSLIAEIIEKLSLKNVVLIGNCVGSAAALQHCISSKAENIRSLVLFNILTAETLSQEANLIIRISRRKFGLKLIKRMAETLRKYSVCRNAVVRFQLKYPHKISIELLRHMSDLNERPESAGNLLRLGKAIHDFDQLIGIKNHSDLPPSMVLWGRHNRVLPHKNGQQFVKNFGPNESYVLPGGHLLMIDNPELCAECISNFIAIKPRQSQANANRDVMEYT